MGVGRTVLGLVGADHEVVAGAEHGQLAGAHRRPLGADGALAGQHVDEGVVVGLPGHGQLGPGGEGGVGVGDGRAGRARAGVVAQRAGDDRHDGATVGRADQGGAVAGQVLVAGGDHLLGGREVDPQLHAVEQPAGGDHVLGRALDVQQPRAGGHPLGVAGAQHAATALAVAVLELAVDEVGDGLEAAVGVPEGALGLTGGVVDLAHLVHVDERVEQGRVDAGEGAADGEALALEPAGGRGHAADPALDRVGGGWGDGVEGEQVVDGIGRHGASSGRVPGSFRVMIPV